MNYPTVFRQPEWKWNFRDGDRQYGIASSTVVIERIENGGETRKRLGTKNFVVPTQFLAYLDARHPSAQRVSLELHAVEGRLYLAYRVDNDADVIYLHYWTRSTAPGHLKRYTVGGNHGTGSSKEGRGRGNVQ